MATLSELTTTVKNSVEQLHLPSEPRLLYEPIRYTLESGGKRIRPLLTLASCNMFSNSTQRAVPAAMGIEVFHNFTLLHDDIMDGSSKRRGRDTVHVKWDDNTAILSGDAMMIFAYNILSQSQPELLPALLRIFNRVATGVCEGQQYDMDFENRMDVSVEDYIMMIELKTSVLLGGAAELGAVAGGATEEDCRKMYDFGRILGLAFQIQDDLLDTYGDPATFGKNIGGDIVSNKKTFLLITALQQAQGEIKQQLKALLSDKNIENNEKIERVREIYSTLGVDTIARRLIEKYYSQAVAIIDSIAVSEQQKEAIRSLTETLIKREK